MSLWRRIADPVAAYERDALRPALMGASWTSKAGFEEFERRGLEGAFNTALRGRLVLLGVVATVSLWMAIADPAPWRRFLMASLVLGLAALDLSTRQRFKRHGVELTNVYRNLAGMMLFQVALIFSTGGLTSPVLPILIPAAFLAGLLADRNGVRRLVLGLQIPALLACALVHITGIMPSIIPLPFQTDGGPSLTRLLFSGAVVSALVMGLAVFGSRLRQEARRNLELLQSAQAAALGEHRQRADDLTTLSGEIAHELKNPLASIKGLAQLLGRTERRDDPKTSERLAVLEREVSRMQATLEEFLNFSRPLTPLTRATVDLHALCVGLVSLHEAMAASQDLSLRVEVARGLAVQGDERKLGQVLINLLQNAMEAAPAGSTVTLRGNLERDAVTIEVEDQGPGLEPSVSGSLFDPGVTTKAEGHGLGLTVARAIARQHGGSLALDDGPDGGCVARLVIPRAQEAA